MDERYAVRPTIEGGNEPTPYPWQGLLPDDTDAELDAAAGVTTVNDQSQLGPQDYAAAELDSTADDADARPAPQSYIKAGTAAAAAPSRVGPQPPQLEAIAWDESIKQAAPQMHRSLHISEVLTRFEMDNCTPLNIPELQRGDVAELPDKTPLASKGELKHYPRSRWER